MVNRLKRYDIVLKESLMHVHTNFTDGECSVDEVVSYAEGAGFKLICITEHVRTDLDYNFEKLKSAVRKANRDHQDIAILLGVEASLLKGGRIDCPH